MKIALSLALLASVSDGFVLSSESQRAASSVLKASVEETATSKLIPPKSIEEIMSHDGETAQLYDANVQKTYGYVVECVFSTRRESSVSFEEDVRVSHSNLVLSF